MVGRAFLHLKPFPQLIEIKKLKIMNSNKKTQRVAWISILQAITITAVLIGHVDLAGDMNPDYPTACWIDRLQVFQMPVFFFISGFLYVRSSLFHKPYWGGGNTQQVEKAWNPILVYVNNDVGIQTMPAIINA
ncbi:MAG: acyltransferase family protein [Prevotella sp.]